MSITNIPQIIALGGGGFSMEPRNPRLDKYILAQSSKKNPKICFIPTASGDAMLYIQRFYRAMEKLQCKPSHLPLFKDQPLSVEKFLLDQDIIYVGGGNTSNMLLLWKAWGVDKALKKAWKKGIILAGISAGSICWFEQGLSDSYPGTLTPIDCLGFLSGSNCPHYDGEATRPGAYRKFVKSKKISPGYAADDGVALHFIGTKLHKILTSRKNAKAYHLKLSKNVVEEVPLDPIFLNLA